MTQKHRKQSSKGQKNCAKKELSSFQPASELLLTIIDCEFDRIKDPEQLEIDINNIPGVVENGLFIGLADEIIVGSKQGIKTLSWFKKLYFYLTNFKS